MKRPVALAVLGVAMALPLAAVPAAAQVPGIGPVPTLPLLAAPQVPRVAPGAGAGASASPFLRSPTDPGPVDTARAGTSDAALGAFQRGRFLSALRIAEPLANMGDAAAQTLIGEIYFRGLGVAQDDEEAARWFRVAAAAGDPQAQLRYAMMLIEGDVTPADGEDARTLMREAADAGNPIAAFNYGQMLIRAAPTGGFAEAYRYFEDAARSGVADGQYALSQLYAYGQGVPEASDTTARRWLHAAAIRGHDTAQLELGIWLINGRGGPAEAQTGFRWLKGVAERGNPIAINRVAHLYRDGIGTERNAVEAAKWAMLARRAGNGDTALDNFLRGLPEDQQRQALEAANRFPTG